MKDELVKGTCEVGDFVIHPKTKQELNVIAVKIREGTTCLVCNEQHKETCIRTLENGEALYDCGSCKKRSLCNVLWKKR